MPIKVCLCGSTRFKDLFIKANKEETLKGKIVLSVGMFGHEELSAEEMAGGEIKKRLDELHLHKIDLADEILVLDQDRYIGSSTRNEIEYAKAKGKRIRYYSEEQNVYV